MTVRKVEVPEATESLENTDLETVALSTDPEFLELIQSSRVRQAEQGGLSTAEMRRRLKGES